MTVCVLAGMIHEMGSYNGRLQWITLWKCKIVRIIYLGKYKWKSLLVSLKERNAANLTAMVNPFSTHTAAFLEMDSQ